MVRRSKRVHTSQRTDATAIVVEGALKTAGPRQRTGKYAAKDIVPQLINLYQQSNQASSGRFRILTALDFIGRDVESVIPFLLREVQSQDAITRNIVCSSLGRIHSQPDVIVPALIQLLNDPDKAVRQTAVHSLEKFGTNAQFALPRLTELRNLEPKDLMTIDDVSVRWWPISLDNAIAAIKGSVNSIDR
jgi:HEAT repeat protein